MEIMRRSMWACRKETFEDKFARLNKVLKKMGKEPFTFHYENEQMVQIDFTYHVSGDAYANDTVRRESVRYVDVVIEGEPVVKLDDKNYEYLGTVSFEEGTKVINCRKEEYLEFFNDKFRKDECDHCGTKRNRNEYYLFLADGKVIQIGSTCVDKYFGINTIKYLIALENTFMVMRDPGFEEYIGHRLESGLEYDCAYSLLAGVTGDFSVWKKSSFDGFHEHGTVSEVKALFFNPQFCSLDCESKGVVKIPREKLIEYWKTQRTTEFSLNVIAALESGYAVSKNFGVFLYGIYGAVKAVRAEMNNTDNAEFVGKVGERLNMELVYDSFGSYNGYYGTSYFIRFHDANGNKFVWKASDLPRLETGKTYKVRGTIKSHREFNGAKETYITRCAVAAA